MTKLVDGLAAEGLARRVRSESDRRVVMVEATAAGRRRLEAGRARRVEAMATALQRLPPAELIRTRGAFDILTRLLK
jgi:DNA-binding MarR family transcriptional regulator